MGKIKANKKLFIVESPAKARTLAKFLGEDYIIKASLGHIRDLPQKGSGKKRLGIDVDNDFKLDYQIIPGKEKVIKDLQDALKKSDTIFLAPDPDREGEAIAWHLKEVMGLKDQEVQRVTYSAITKKAVLDAIANPRPINMDLVDAQQSRRALDRLVGFELSPFLWKKVVRNLSAGRVQSVAVKLIVDREKEIRVFIPEEFWRIEVLLQTQDKEIEYITAQMTEWQEKKFELGNPVASSEEPVKEIIEELRSSEFTVIAIEEKNQKRNPSPPFITSTLQQAASNAFGMAPSRTMLLAQKLYEGVDLGKQEGHVGLITYMRTDSVRIAPEAIEEVREYIKGNFSSGYLPSKPNIYGKSSNAQDAHEAIRPTSIFYTPEKLSSFLDKDSLKLYTLIWQRFLASQLAPAQYLLTKIKIGASQAIFEVNGRVTLFDGFTKIFNEKESEVKNLPKVNVDEKLSLKDLTPTQNFTKPPNRYSEAGLIKAMEKEGIGRPSTYAPTIKTIKERGYVRLEERSFHATELGIAVTEILEKHFSKIMDLEFTASMENDLDKIEHGKLSWVNLLKTFYSEFHENVEKALKEAEPLTGKPYEGEEVCPICESSLVIRYSKNGAFLSCSKYPDCKGVRPMPGEENKNEVEQPDNPPECPKCGKTMILKMSRFKTKFFACSDYPECKETLPENYDSEEEIPDIKYNCDRCHKIMEIRKSKSGYSLRCSDYPNCKYSLPILADGTVFDSPFKEKPILCEKCNSEMVVRMAKRGPFLGCSAFPKCRNLQAFPKKDGEEEKKPKRKTTKAKTTTKSSATTKEKKIKAKSSKKEG